MHDVEKQHYHGHRERVRKRFLQQGLGRVPPQGYGDRPGGACYDAGVCAQPPDGNVSPSEFDKTLTRGLVLAACLCGSTAVYDGQMVRRDHVLHDGDVVELRI